jgi:GPH family glycoside/pentoside/hexuronide:cation symporter
MMVLALIPALTLKEKKKTYVEKQERVSVLKSLKFTFGCKPYVYLIIAFFAALCSYNTIATTYAYPLRYYVCAGDAELNSIWFGRIEAFHHVATLIALVPINILAKRFSKRSVGLLGPVFIIIGSLANFFCYVPDMPWLVLIPRGFAALGLATLFVLVPSMIADVVDFDEQQTGTRREGMFGAVHFWVIKLALAIGLVATGFIVEATGFNVDFGINQPEGALDKIISLLGLLPTIGAFVALYFISRYPLTEKTMYEIRLGLEKRRGVS